ncbi:hypothetical protein ACLX1H_009799 [Fusarium chlamydosporum]
MRSTAALRMFRQTPRMLRPVPFRVTEGGPGWYVITKAFVKLHRTDRNFERGCADVPIGLDTNRIQGHTISQRLRKLKQIPPELYPLAVVVGFALGAAGYSISRKFIVDKNLRLARQGAAARQANSSHGESEGH